MAMAPSSGPMPSKAKPADIPSISMARGKAQGVARKWSLEGELAGQWVMSNGAVVQAITNAAELGALTQTGGRP